MELQIKRDWGRIRKTPDELGRYRCSKCQNWKHPKEFNKSKSQTSGLCYSCRECSIKHNKKWQVAKYGISVDEFNKKFIEQDGKCACCNIDFIMNSYQLLKSCVDHNHKTQQIRDLLCGRCNLAAGNVQDSSFKAKQLASYLEKWGS